MEYDNDNVTHTGHRYYPSISSLRFQPFLQWYTSASIVIPAWNTVSIFGLMGAMLAAIVSSIAYECLHEYLIHLRCNAALRKDGPTCCRTSAVTCREKLAQTVIQVFRVSCAYFMVMCIMTMNIWLLISISVGAAIGYGVGKPLVANNIADTISSHGYKTAAVKIIHRENSRSEMSKSWRYQQISGNCQLKLKPQKAEMHFSDDFDYKSNKARTNTTDISEIIWLRRSSEDLRRKTSFIQSERQLKDDTNQQSHSISLENQMRSPSLDRFKSTSKVINETLKANASKCRVSSQNANVVVHDERHGRPFQTRGFKFVDSKMHPSESLTSANVSPFQNHTEIGQHKKCNVSQTSSSSISRFKPVSREILRHMLYSGENNETVH